MYRRFTGFDAASFYHRHHHAGTQLIGARFNRRDNLRRRVQGQTGGSNANQQRLFARQLLCHAVGNVVQLRHRRFHLFPRFRRDVAGLVHHAGNGLIRDTGILCDIV
ncbi:Uncharacterised protein [Enterobacter ludwigii]|nr:hypothetical protein MTE1_5142 [Klebsiella pneumoniae JHCK1]EMI36650.1 hypothetical protein MTE2_4701 [Klebsiella pneumoniae VA360]SAG55316.1 Uncharacterised protein [Enterobacter ludwigii]